VSQVHARLFQANGSTSVEDLGSTNGSYLNGARLTSVQPISKGDRLQIGSTIFEAH
jgi:pSer/pThr/pTyr-binding forkhead associated (FHA) protein